MPVFEYLDGIKICIYSNDHVPPHIHASIGEFESLIDIKQEVEIVGNLPIKHLRKAILFVSKNKTELIEAFYSLNPNIKIL